MMSAEEFLHLLGKDPAETFFRTIAPKSGCNRSRKGRDLHGFDRAALLADNQAGSSVYFVTGNANEGTGKSGAIRDEDVHGCPALFVEWDHKPIEWQVTAWQELKLPEPTAMVFSGGKSVQAYWSIEPMEPESWRMLQLRLIDYADGDRACKNPSRVMRLPGFRYIDKSTGTITDKCAELIHQGGARYSSAEIEACLPAMEATQSAVRSKSGPKGPKPGKLGQMHARSDLPLVREILRDVLQPADRFSDYDTWLGVGMICSDTSQRAGNDEALLDAWLQWSRQMQNFDEYECMYKWQSFTGSGLSEYNIKVGSLIKFVKENVNNEWKKTNPRQRIQRSTHHG